MTRLAADAMIILCDVDNVISDDSWRVKFIAHHRVDARARYHEYHAAALLDAAANLELVKDQRATVFFLTAMPEEYAYLREAWLRNNRIRYERVLYRAANDRRPSPDVKRSMLKQLRVDGVPLREVVAAYDDQPAIVAMYNEEGLPGKLVKIHDLSYGDQSDPHGAGPCPYCNELKRANEENEK